MIRHELVRILRKFFSLKSHTHGNISNDGKISNTSGKIITTGENGELQASAYISKNQISDFPLTIQPATHTHNKSEITDFNHTHTISQISDFSHTHNKNQITDFNHNHGDISNDGKITSNDTGNVKKAVVTDNNNNVKTITKIPFANLNITKANITGLGIPSSDTNTTYTAGNGLTLTGTTFSVDEASATDIIHDTSDNPLPNIIPDLTPGTSVQISQSDLNSAFDGHTHLNQWTEISVPKGTLFVNTKLGLAEYLYDGSFAFPTANVDTQFHNTRIIPAEYTPVYRMIQVIHFATGGLTLGCLDPDGKIRGRSYSNSTKSVAIHFLYRYRKQGESDVPSSITL